MPIDYDNLLNYVPSILLQVPIAERDKTYVAPSQLQLHAEFMALKMKEDEVIKNNPEAIAERVRLIQANLLHDMNLAYSRYYDPNNTALYDAIVKELLENAERDLNAIPGYAEYKAGIGAPTIEPAHLTDNYQISDDQVLKNYNMVNYARNSFSNIGSGAYYMPVDYRDQNAVNSYVNNAKVLANFINDALATAGIGYGINNISKLGTLTAKGLQQAGRLFTPSEYIPGINYYGRLISPGWRGLSANVGRWADAIAFGGTAGYFTLEAINNPNLENITYAGLSYLPFLPIGIKAYNGLRGGINYLRENGLPLFNMQLFRNTFNGYWNDVKKGTRHFFRGYNRELNKMQLMNNNELAYDNNLRVKFRDTQQSVYDKQKELRSQRYDYIGNGSFPHTVLLDEISDAAILERIDKRFNAGTYLLLSDRQNNVFKLFSVNAPQNLAALYRVPIFGTDLWVSGSVINYPGWYRGSVVNGEFKVTPNYLLGLSAIDNFNYNIPGVSDEVLLDVSRVPKYYFPNNGTRAIGTAPKVTLTKTTPNILSSEPLTTPSSLLLALLHDINYIENVELPGSKVFGSSRTVSEGLASNIPNDFDVYMTEEAISKIDPSKLSVSPKSPTSYNGKPVLYNYHMDPKYSSTNGPGNNIEINVVSVDANGRGNERAEQIYRQFFPEEWRRSGLQVATSPEVRLGYVPIVDMEGNVISAQLLLDAYDPVVGSGLDALEAAKSKHMGKFFNYFINDNPKYISDVLDKMVKVAFGENGHKLPKLKFGSYDDNVKLLIDLNYPAEAANIIAKDPEMMQNALDYWYISERSLFRATNTGGMHDNYGTLGDLLRNATTWNIDAGGGTYSGGGLNSTIGGSSLHSRQIYVRTLPYIEGLKDGMDARTAVKTIDLQMGLTPVTLNDIDFLLSRGLSVSGLSVGLDPSILHYYAGDPSKGVKLHMGHWVPGEERWFNEFLTGVGRRGIPGLNYRGTYYYGSGQLDPSVDVVSYNIGDVGTRGSEFEIVSPSVRKAALKNLGSLDINDFEYALLDAAIAKNDQYLESVWLLHVQNNPELKALLDEIDFLKAEYNRLDKALKDSPRRWDRLTKIQRKIYEKKAQMAGIKGRLLTFGLPSAIFGLLGLGIYHGNKRNNPITRETLKLDYLHLDNLLKLGETLNSEELQMYNKAKILLNEDSIPYIPLRMYDRMSVDDLQKYINNNRK